MADSAKKHRPNWTAFKQQRLSACQPILTPIPVIITFLIVAVVFIPIGIVLLLASNSVVEYESRYDLICANLSKCSIELDISEKMNAPVYVYYKLTNYYQNHRRYVKSRNDDQLRGKRFTSYGSLSLCDPVRSIGNLENDTNLLLDPCGLVAASVFNDSFSLSGSSGKLDVLDNGIAWPSDINEKFKNPTDPPYGNYTGDWLARNQLFNSSTGGRGLENERFIVWMRIAGLPTFRKLWGRIENDIEPGKFLVEIENNYPVNQFDGKKYFILSTASWIGGKNPFLGISYLVIGGLCAVLGFVFVILHVVKPRQFGDAKYLEWNK